MVNEGLSESSRRLWNGIATCVVGVEKLILEPRAFGEDNRRREYILNFVLLGAIVVSSAMEVLLAWSAAHPTGHSVNNGLSPFLFAALPMFSIVLYVLSRRGLIKFASYVLVFAMFFGNLYFVYRWGIDVPTAIAGYALIIIITSILLGTRFGFAMTGFVALAIMGLWYIQSQGMVLTDEKVFTGGDAATLALMYGIVMVVASLSNREVERSLSRARQSERELREERDLLEVRVEERTRDLQKAQFEKVENVHCLAEFGELASGLFHDLVNIVTAVLPKADVGLTSDPVSSENDIEALTGQVKDFTEGMRRQLHEKAVPEWFSADDAIVSAIRLLSYEARRENVALEFDGAPGAMIFGDPFRFHHVVTNLISNAIASYRTIKDIRERKIRILIRANGGLLSVVVRDNGCGIPDDTQKKIFEPFFTMKTGGSGLGIGLAVVKRIVERDFHGMVGVESVVGRGSVFTVAVPVIEVRKDKKG